MKEDERTKRDVRKLRRVMLVPASPEEVFAFLDDTQKTGSHMQRGEMGVKLQLGTLSENSTGVGATHRWRGRAYGLRVDFTTVVEKWTKDREKRIHTIGTPKMVIMSGYDMHWALVPADGGTSIEIEFEYELPRSLFGRALSRLVGKRYGDWCLDMILGDAVRALERSPVSWKAQSHPRSA